MREAARGNAVPVVRTMLADLQTPVGAFMRLADGEPYAFLLESAEGGERVARYSFLGANPWMVVRGRGRKTFIEIDGEQLTERDERAVDFLREHFRARKLARSRSTLAPLAGGAVGFFSYDAARWFEPALEKGYENAATYGDDAVWMFYRTLLAFDRVRQHLLITSVVFPQDAAGSRIRLRELYDGAVEETERIEKLLLKPPSPPESKPLDERSASAQFQSNWTRERFEEAVREVKERIAAGDCYQLVLSQKFRKRVTVEPLAIYRALRALNPSPYMYLLRLKNEAVIGASPEMLIRCRGQRLDYRPVAGTRKRGATETEDWLLGEEMRTDEREMAAHTMHVDLGRGDLGRVADYGSVEVGELMAVERYSHVQHLVTTLRARLGDRFDRFDALAACFPASTVTGAPKMRAMQLIGELEPESRGVYAGAVGYLDYTGNLDSCIAIRPIVIKEEEVIVQAGAAIVADSVPEREYEEAVARARSIVRAIEMAEKGF